jgi:hypothetical protein
VRLAEDSRQNVSRGSRDWRTMRGVLFLASHSQDDAVSLSSYNVWANLIQIEDDTSDVWTGAMLRSSDLAYAIGVHRDIFRAAVTDRVREIQQDAVWIHRSINLGLDRGADCDFDP